VKGYIWKILVLVTLLYVVIFGLGAKLSPGILGVENGKLNSGSKTEIHITGYNTHFQQAESNLQAWYQSGNINVCASTINILDDTHLSIIFEAPSGLPFSNADLFINNNTDGTLFYDNALFIKGNDPSLSPPASCEVAIKTSGAMSFGFPNRSILNETIRNLHFHVPMWFAMMFIMFISLFHSIRYLSSSNLNEDNGALQAVNTGLVFALLGLATGSLWARFTWGTWWVDDTKLNGAAITTLIYLAYLILRSSVNDEAKRARLSAVYNIFAYVMLLLFLMVIPRLTDSLHPGSGGNPAFSKYDLDSSLRMIFYPAVAAWIGLAYWIYTILKRMAIIKQKIEEHETNMFAN
jgi:heme exporter protein C